MVDDNALLSVHGQHPAWRRHHKEYRRYRAPPLSPIEHILDRLEAQLGTGLRTSASRKLEVVPGVVIATAASDHVFVSNQTVFRQVWGMVVEWQNPCLM